MLIVDFLEPSFSLHLWMLNEHCMAEMQNQDMKPEAQIIMKLQDLDGYDTSSP